MFWVGLNTVQLDLWCHFDTLMIHKIRRLVRLCGDLKPRGSIYTTIMELGPKRPSLLWFWEPNSIIGAYVDPLGNLRGAYVLDRLLGFREFGVLAFSVAGSGV